MSPAQRDCASSPRSRGGPGASPAHSASRRQTIACAPVAEKPGKCVRLQNQFFACSAGKLTVLLPLLCSVYQPSAAAPSRRAEIAVGRAPAVGSGRWLGWSPAAISLGRMRGPQPVLFEPGIRASHWQNRRGLLRRVLPPGSGPSRGRNTRGGLPGRGAPMPGHEGPSARSASMAQTVVRSAWKGSPTRLRLFGTRKLQSADPRGFEGQV